MTTRRPRGRPHDPSKREAVIDAGRRLFLEHGFAAVTMDQIVAGSGVARATFYANFTDKAALLEAVVQRESARIVVHQEPVSPGDLRASLHAAGSRLLTFLFDPEMIRFDLLMGTIPDRELARRYYAAGPGRTKASLIRLITQAQEEGRLVRENPETAVSDLIGLWEGNFRIEAFAQGHPPASGAEIESRVEHGVRQFLRLYGVARRAPKGRRPRTRKL